MPFIKHQLLLNLKGLRQDIFFKYYQSPTKIIDRQIKEIRLVQTVLIIHMN